METEHLPTEENPIDLLKKVIETTEENISYLIETKFVREDLLNLFGEIEAQMRGLGDLSETLKNFGKEEVQRMEYLIQKIPTKTELVLDKESLQKISFLNQEFQKINHKSSIFKTIFLGNIGSLVFSVVILGLSVYLSMTWYKESICSKQELRAEILTEMEREGKVFYDKNDVETLQRNTLLINKWIEKNPREAKNFLIFKKGYESK